LTDGTPAGEAPDTLSRVLRQASQAMAQTRYGPDALSVMISQIGADIKARDWLAGLDTDPAIGGLVDVTSAFELESQELMQKTGLDVRFSVVVAFKRESFCRESDAPQPPPPAAPMPARARGLAGEAPPRRHREPMCFS
jgi:hypothetical protein